MIKMHKPRVRVVPSLIEEFFIVMNAQFMSLSRRETPIERETYAMARARQYSSHAGTPAWLGARTCEEYAYNRCFL